MEFTNINKLKQHLQEFYEENDVFGRFIRRTIKMLKTFSKTPSPGKGINGIKRNRKIRSS